VKGEKKVRAEVERIAQPLTMLALMWLMSNPDPKWRQQRGGVA
jgi:hypothetical protein